MKTTKYLKGILKTVKGSGIFNVIASTSAIDRQGESIDQNGWDLENFKKNPVILWAHNYDELPLGVAENTEVGEEGLVLSGRFADVKANPKAEQVRLLYEDSILQAVSVGFIPHEREGNVITKAELLEVSFVPVPANPQALALAMSTKGISKDLIEQIKAEEPEEPEEPDEPEVEEKQTEIQTIILSKEIFPTLEMAQAWAIENDFKTEKVDETETSWRFRQFEPTMCIVDSFATIELTTGVSATVCEPLTQEELAVIIAEIELKSGRVLSSKNRKLIGDSINTLKQSTTILQELLVATEPAPKSGGSIETDGGQLNQRSASNNGEVEIPIETLKELQSHTRQADKHNELASTILKRVLKR